MENLTAFKFEEKGKLKTPINQSFTKPNKNIAFLPNKKQNKK